MITTHSAPRVLDIDAGNTFIKWRLRGSAKVDRQLTAQLPLKKWQCDLPNISRVCIANVAGDAVRQILIQQAQQLWGVTPDVACVRPGVAGVKPSYSDLSRLGVDRWLAMLAVFSVVQNACVVMSAGSALTADWLDADGNHLGGLIAPGQARLVASLHRDLAQVLRTSQLPPTEFSQALGVSTEGCSAAGVRVMMAGFMAEVVGHNKDIPIWLAGGDSGAMLSLCAHEQKHRIKKVDNLVLEGLAVALP